MFKIFKLSLMLLATLALPEFFPFLSSNTVGAQVATDSTSVTTTVVNPKTVPIAIEKIRISIPPTEVIGEVRIGLFGIVTEQFSTNDLGDGSSFLPIVYKGLQEQGYKPAVELLANPSEDPGSVFSDMNSGSQTKSPAARFLVGGTITKVWMTVAPDAWAGWSTDIDMRVKWEVYDTLQNKVIYTKETYAVDAGGGRTNAYYQTVMAKAAASLFSSPEFERALQNALAISVPGDSVPAPIATPALNITPQPSQ